MKTLQQMFLANFIGAGLALLISSILLFSGYQACLLCFAQQLIFGLLLIVCTWALTIQKAGKKPKIIIQGLLLSSCLLALWKLNLEQKAYEASLLVCPISENNCSNEGPKIFSLSLASLNLIYSATMLAINQYCLQHFKLKEE